MELVAALLGAQDGETSPKKGRYIKAEPKYESESDDQEEVDNGDTSQATRSSSKRQPYRKNYSMKDLLNAYNMVKYENMPVQTAAKTFGVPSTTLRDRVRGNVNLESVRPGPSSLLSIEQEMTLVDHISYMASIGCGYTRSDIFDLATSLAVHLGLIEEGRQLQRSWYRRFRSRWPVINAVRPKKNSRKRSQAAIALEQESIKKYFEELRAVLEKHDLLEKPQRIFTYDESFVPQTRDMDAPETCAKILGCGNGIGSALPPYLVFPESPDPACERPDDKVVQSAPPGSLIRFRENYDDWSEAEIFQDYVQAHFLKSAEVGGATPEDPVLILYDRTKHHISSCIDWARKLNVVLFLLPPFYGYAARSEEIGCLGQLKRICLQECHKFLFFNLGKVVNKTELCKFICQSYEKVMTPTNLIALFRKTGTYPYNPDGIAKDRLHAYIIMPNQEKVAKTSDTLTSAFIQQTRSKARKTPKKGKTTKRATVTTSRGKRKVKKEVSSESDSEFDWDSGPESAEAESDPDSEVEIRRSPRSSRTSGFTVKRSVELITAEVTDSSRETQTEQSVTVPVHNVLTEGVPEPEVPDEEEEYTCYTDGELFALRCVICKKYNPPPTFMTEGESVISWTQCDSCQAWSHLCCSTLSIPFPDCPFLCPTCTAEFKLFCNNFTSANITEWLNAKRAITENILSAQNG
ncbi:uncharacterized protein LOC135475379 isoform X2 [Liolophura sinensis]|uniref:uncharacterized protein LOC135475379 isoform X2 n=1 Tax=Liolophura sinensis TaxID=3198878 RepID=UPI0031599004